MGDPMAKMDIRTSGATIKTPAASAIFLPGLSRRRSTVRPSSRSFLQTSLAYVRRCVRPIRLCRDWVAAFERRLLAQGRPCDPCQLVCQRDDDGIAVDSALDHSCQPAPQWGLASRQRRQCCPGAVDEQGAQVGIASLGDAEQPRLAAGSMLTGHQAEPGTQVSGFGKAAGIAHGCSQGVRLAPRRQGWM